MTAKLGCGSCEYSRLMLWMSVLWRVAGLMCSVGLPLVVAVSACGGNESWPHPPKTEPVDSLVLLSANGRVLTARGAMACGRRPLLVARSDSDRVTLTWVNPDTSCNAEAIKQVIVSTTLPMPLGSRILVQAATGRKIRYQKARQ